MTKKWPYILPAALALVIVLLLAALVRVTSQYRDSRRIVYTGTYCSHPENRTGDENVWLAVMSDGEYVLYSNTATVHEGAYTTDGRRITLEENVSGVLADGDLYLFDAAAGKWTVFTRIGDSPARVRHNGP